MLAQLQRVAMRAQLVRSLTIGERFATLRTEPVDIDGFRKSIYFLESADVSELELLTVLIDDSWRNHFRAAAMLDGRAGCEPPGLGTILGSGRFSALKKLEIQVIGTSSELLFHLGLGSASLAEAFRKGKFINLRELIIRVNVNFSEYNNRNPDTHDFDLDEIFEALVNGGFTQLTSLSAEGPSSGPSSSPDVDRMSSALLKSASLRNLRSIRAFSYRQWTVLANAIKWGLLPNLISLALIRIHSENLLHLADIVEGSGDWFSSLKHFTVCECKVTSEEVCAFVDAIMKVPKSPFALEVLNLSKNDLDDEAVHALARLVESGRLPQLQELDWSGNSGRFSKNFPRFMETIQRDHLPGLKTLNWKGNGMGSDDKEAKAVARAYFENGALTADIEIDWHRVRDQSLVAKVKEYKDRNGRLVGLRNMLDSEESKNLVPLKSAKVFLCGYPEVGKTTLRLALGRQFGLKTRFVLERRNPKLFKEPRTMGIEMSRIQDKKKTSLTFWDLAGQEEFHVLHGAFLADLGSVGSKATLFVLVFKVPFEEPFEKNVEAKLLYWLKFVASGSVKYAKRHVLTVLNRFDGGEWSKTDEDYWMGLIAKFTAQFSDVLYIHSDPFVIDVRFAEWVQPLKTHLFQEAQRLLEGVQIPKACFDVLNDLKDLSEGKLLKALKGSSLGTITGRNKRSLPIFTWQAFEEGWKVKYKIQDVPSKGLKICASYLHEIGEIIYFDRMEPTEPETKSRSIVVPDAQWFCKDVVGRLLLPENILEGRSSTEVSAHGSISLIRFGSFFQHMLPKGTQSDDVVSMLEHVGLCYRKGTEEIIVPALVRKDDYRKLDWEGKGFYGVMGRSLASEDKDTSAIPATLFRKLQVELAQDPSLGGRGDSEYRTGRSFSSFKLGELLVLVQFDVDHSDPSDDRIDVLVKSVLNENSKDVNSAKIYCICEIMQKLERLCVTWCPGLTYDVKVIQPWNATKETPKMTERQLISLTEMKALVVKGNRYSSWELSCQPVELKTFLSESELRGVLGTAEREYDECKREAVSLGLLTEDSLQKLEEFEQANFHDARGLDGEEAATECQSDHGPHITSRQILDEVRQQGDLTRKAVHDDGHLTRQYIEKLHQVLLSEIRHKQNALVRLIQAQQEFSIEEGERSVPRYIFLSRKQGKSNLWIIPREALNQSFELHLLCEAHFDHGSFHEVDGQEGIQLTKPKEWLVKISPWLRRSLQVAIMVGKTVGNVYLPGVFNFIPDLDYLQDDREGWSNAAETAATLILEEDEGVQGDHSNYGTAAGPVDLRERMIAEGVVKDLIRKIGEATFMKKIGLRKVLLRAAPQPHHVGSSMQAQSFEAQSSVRWICDNCYRCYGSRARAIA